MRSRDDLFALLSAIERPVALVLGNGISYLAPVDRETGSASLEDAVRGENAFECVTIDDYFFTLPAEEKAP